MIFNWTYKRKNRALIVVILLLLLLSWYLALGKTCRLITKYQRLNASVDTERTMLNTKVLNDRFALQDSLITHFKADSTQWVSNLLIQVGGVLSNHPIGVTFENKPIGANLATVEREVTLEGSFSALQQALSKLEEHFFIQSVRAFVEKEQLKYNVRLAIVKINNE